jgi:HPt (histidine-containing phosphotransfer) domain-containing protein
VGEPPDGWDDDLAEIWQQAKPRLLERCEVVRRAATHGDEASREDARAASHRLAGSVGMFGFEQASALALDLDALIVAGALTDDRRTNVASMAVALAAMLDAFP